MATDRGGLQIPKLKQKAENQGGTSRIIFLLAILFALILLAHATNPSPTPNTPVPSAHSHTGYIVMTVIPWALLIIVVGFAVRFLHMVSYNKEQGEQHNKAVRLLDAGELSDARKLLEELLLTLKPNQAVVLRQAALHNLSMIAFQQGEYAEAIERIDEGLALKAPKYLAGRLGEAKTLLYLIRGEAQAYLGLADRAEESLQEALTHLPPENPSRALPLRAAIALRQGQFETAASMLAEQWAEAEGVLTGNKLKRCRLLWAFAISQLEPSPERDVEKSQLVAGLQPNKPGEFDYLCKEWPELRAFIAGLTSAPLA